MKRRRIILIGALAAVVTGVALGLPRGPKEPVYQGKGIYQWLAEADADRSPTRWKAASAAVKDMGTNALPKFLADFTRPVSPWRKRFNQWASAHPRVQFRVRDDERLIKLSGHGLRILGSNAFPAAPVVAPYLGDPSRGVTALNILINSGKAGEAHLLQALNSTNVAVARLAIFGTFRLVLASEAVRGANVTALRHADAEVRQRAAMNLGRVGVWADHVVPPLIEAMNDRSPGVNQAVTNALMELRERVGPATALMISNAFFIDFLSPLRLPPE